MPASAPVANCRHIPLPAIRLPHIPLIPIPLPRITPHGGISSVLGFPFPSSACRVLPGLLTLILNFGAHCSFF